MRIAFFSLILAAAVATPVLSFAQDEAAPAQEQQQQPESDNPHQKDVEAAALVLAKSLDEKQVEAVTRIRTGFGMIRAVKVVGRDVGKAVEQCGRDNPDMKDGISTRFAAWKKAVDPEIKNNEKKMDAAIKAAAFSDEKQVLSYLDAIEKAADYADARIEKRIVTTPEACESLQKSMDGTQDTIVGILSKVEWTVPAASDAGAPPQKQD